MPKMKSYGSYADWRKDQTKKAQSLIGPLRKLVKSCSASFEEAMKWGNVCWTIEKLSKTDIDAKYFTTLIKKAMKIKYR